MPESSTGCALDANGLAQYHFRVFETLTLTTRSRQELVEITAQVRDIVSRTQTESGTLLVYVPHTTAAVTVNERADPSVGKDISSILSRLVPKRSDYAHDEGNADAHAKAALVGTSVMLMIENGDVVLGTWQGIFFCEFDGPRRRSVFVRVTRDQK